MWCEEIVAGQARLGAVTVIFSEAELDSILEEHSDRLIVLEASLTWCRPCKGFERVFQASCCAFRTGWRKPSACNHD